MGHTRYPSGLFRRLSTVSVECKRRLRGGYEVQLFQRTSREIQVSDEDVDRDVLPTAQDDKARGNELQRSQFSDGFE